MSGVGYIAEYPWDEGDTVFASALNAAIGNSVAIGSSLVINVKNYGARGDGVTDDTTAIQNAANGIPAAGGTLLFPQGVYVVHQGIAVPSNTSVRGEGATLKAAPAGFITGPLLRNVNSSATTLTDHDIAVRAMAFDYGTSGAGGASHCIDFAFVRNALVAGCTFQCRGAGDAVALIGCYNTLIDSCTAYGFTNCAYDHWWGPSYARLTNCYAETAMTNQIVNFNPDSTSGTPANLTAKGFVMANCTLVALSPAAIANQIEPLTNGTVTDVLIGGNVFVNCLLFLRGASHNFIIASNVFDTALGGGSVIACYPGAGGSPANITITGNVITNPATVAGNTAVMVVETDTAVVSSNTVTGATISCLDTSSHTPVVTGNYFSNGIMNVPASSAQIGRMQLSSGLGFGAQTVATYSDLSKHIALYSNTIGISVTPSAVNFVVSSGNAYQFYIGTTNVGYIDGGGLHMVIGQGGGNAGSFTTVTTFGGAVWSSNLGAPSSTAPIGSLYSRTDGGVGSTLYVSRGGGTWAPVAGV